MMTRNETRAIRKIQGLRARRLQLADLEVSRANAAVETAASRLSDASVALVNKVTYCQQEHQRLNEELANGIAVEKEKIYAWSAAHKQLDKQLIAARKDVTDAEAAVQTARRMLEQVKLQRRVIAVDVERLNVLLAV